MDSLLIYKEQLLNNYISSIENLSEVNYNQMKSELRNILGEEPAIRINYKQESTLNEKNGETIQIEKMDSITIIYTHEVDGKIYPTSKEFLL